MLIIYAGTNGFLDELPVEQCREFEAGLYQFVENSKPGVLQGIREKKALDDDLKNQIAGAIREYRERFVKEHKPAAATA